MSLPASQSAVERSYVYQPSWRRLLRAAIFLSLAAAVLVWQAATNQRGLIIDEVMRLSIGQAISFYWFLAASAGGALFLLVFFALHRLNGRDRIVFAPSALVVPKSRWSHEERSIPYASITGLRVWAFAREKCLTIRHRGGRYQLVQSYLESPAVFAEIGTLLAERVKWATTGEVPQIPGRPSPPASAGHGSRSRPPPDGSAFGRRR
jgi:hypothetical protein